MLDVKYRDYNIVTQRELHDYIEMDESKEEKFREQLQREQTEILEKEITTESVIIHFIEDTHYCSDLYKYTKATEIDEYIQYLAIKDGLDLVRFSNGNLGYVAYYNGHKNAFEIIQTEMTEEEFEEVDWYAKWYNVELPREKANDFKEFLQSRCIKFEPSECENNIHFEVFCNRIEMETVNKFLEGGLNYE